MDSTVRRTTDEVARPVGVWLLTIFDALVAGVFPFVTAFAVLDGGVDAVPGGTMTALLLAAIGIGVMGAALGTWQGTDRARVVLLLLLVLFYGVNMLASLRLATAAWVPDDIQTRSWATLFRGVFWISINVWYFLRPQTRAWFQAMQRSR